MDKFTPEQRRKCMASIHSKNTKPEIIVRKYLFALGFRYRINVKRLPGTPDIVLNKYKCAIFINGCFWHGHENCECYSFPKSNVEFWEKKIARNKERDALVAAKLRGMNWYVIQLWECQLRPKKRKETLDTLVNTLKFLHKGKPQRALYEDSESEISYIAAEPDAEYNT